MSISRPANIPPTVTIRVWGASAAGKPLRHPATGRAPGDISDGVSVPDDAFTARRIMDGDWTTNRPDRSHADKPSKPAKADHPRSN